VGGPTEDFYDKFFNVLEMNSAVSLLTTARQQEKADSLLRSCTLEIFYPVFDDPTW
jgi:hypothetical protein